MRVPLVANDNAAVDISLPAARLSRYLKDIIPPDGVLTEPIPVPGADGETLSWVCDFLEQRLENEFFAPGFEKIRRPLARPESLVENGVATWAAEWVMAKPLLKTFDLLRGAEFMGCDELMDLAAARIAFKYMHLTYQQRKTLFALPEDMTPEEEAKIREEHKWAELEPDLDLNDFNGPKPK